MEQGRCKLPGATDMQLLIMQDCQSLVIGTQLWLPSQSNIKQLKHLLISSIIKTKTMIYFRFANVVGLMLFVRCTRHMINTLSNIRRIIVIPTITACQYIFCPLSHISIWIVWCWYRCWWFRIGSWLNRSFLLFVADFIDQIHQKARVQSILSEVT